MPSGVQTQNALAERNLLQGKCQYRKLFLVFRRIGQFWIKTPIKIKINKSKDDDYRER